MLFLSIESNVFILNFILFLVLFIGLGFIKAFLHEVVWQYGIIAFRKKYFITYIIYFVIFIAVNLIYNTNFNTVFCNTFLFVILLVDLIIYYIIDYRHMFNVKNYITFSIMTFFVGILWIELLGLIIRTSTQLALGY